jgi:drug/metabolite transporter (DMT)-like permease
VSPQHKAFCFSLVFTISWVIVESVAGTVLARYSPFQVVWTRYLFHLLALVVLFGWQQGPMRLLRTQRLGYQIFRSLLMLIMPTAWIAGRHFDMSMSQFMPVFWLSPLIVAALASWLLQERPGPTIWIAAALASGGAMLQYGGRVPVHDWRLLFPLAMAASFSLYVVMTRSLRDESVLVNLSYTALGVFLALTPVMPEVWQMPTAADLRTMITVGILGLFSLYMLDRMASAAPVFLSAPLIATQVLFTTLASVVIERSLPGKVAMMGVFAVVVSAAVVWNMAGNGTRESLRQVDDLQGSN